MQLDGGSCLRYEKGLTVGAVPTQKLAEQGEVIVGSVLVANAKAFVKCSNGALYLRPPGHYFCTW
jgi:hypothetical protein